MNRKKFIHKAIMSVVGFAIAPIIVKDEFDSGYTYTLIKEGPKFFKISEGMWIRDFSLNIADLDKLCIEKCGSPVKEIGYMDDDFAKGMLTVFPFARDGSNDPALLTQDRN